MWGVSCLDVVQRYPLKGVVIKAIFGYDVNYTKAVCSQRDLFLLIARVRLLRPVTS